MEKFESFEDVWKSLENDPDYLTEKLSIDFITELHQLMKKRNLSKKDIAEKIGTSPAYVSKVFNRTCNLTLSSMSKFVLAVDGKINIHITPKEKDCYKWIDISKKATEYKFKKPKEVIRYAAIPQRNSIYEAKAA